MVTFKLSHRRWMSRVEKLPSRLATQAHLPEDVEDVMLRIVGKQKPRLIH